MPGKWCPIAGHPATLRERADQEVMIARGSTSAQGY
jgi:hypothetical protein